MSDLARLPLRIAPDRIHFLKFVLEGYDNLAVLSTVDARLGMVEIRYPAMVEVELSALLESLTSTIGISSPIDTENG